MSCPIGDDLENRAGRVCAPLSLRCGIATGRALLFEGDDYIGSAVNMAARLCDLARDVDVLMPTMQLERLPDAVRHFGVDAAWRAGGGAPICCCFRAAASSTCF